MPLKDGPTRGGVRAGLPVAQNFAMFFGCRPALGVLADTTMVKDVVDILLVRYNRRTFAVQFPNCFDDLKGNDANFEMVASNTLQPLLLEYTYNKTEKEIALIIANSFTGGFLANETKLKDKTWSELKTVALSDNPDKEFYKSLSKFEQSMYN